jgi:toxin ParE1/3/4
LSVAERFTESVEAALSLLASLPGLGPPYESDDLALQQIRFWPLKGFRNYLLFYLPLDTGGIRLIRVIHGARQVPPSELEQGPT